MQTLNLSKEAKEILDSIGNGMCLCISRTTGECKLVWPLGWSIPEDVERDVSVVASSELLNTPELLTEMQEQPVGQRAGWRECGLPGDTNRIFACTQ